MLGCDLHCRYCQNWITSQALRDDLRRLPILDVTPEAIVAEALDHGARFVVSTYNEPLITSEWAVAVFKEARTAGLMTGFVSNGNATPRGLEYLRPWLDLFKVDLKTFDDRRYRSLGARLGPILESIRWLYEAGVWLEVVTLLVPGFNDSESELTGLVEFLAGISSDIPWHVTAFHPDYRMTEVVHTTPAMLRRAAEIGRRAGLRYVYGGNLPGSVGDLEDTRCPSCQQVLVERHGYRIGACGVTAEGRCPSCGSAIAGRWAATEGMRPPGTSRSEWRPTPAPERL